MSSIPVPDYPFAAPKEDARDLLARLYREIGIAAVAAALEIPEAAPAHSVQTLEQQISDVIKRKDMAA
jgi:hypothetical protein